VSDAHSNHLLRAGWIAGYDDLGVRDINSRLPSLSDVDLSTVEAYERKHKKRKTILQKIESLRNARD
jgi:hypothetical protein